MTALNAIWIDEGTQPDYGKLAGRGFTHLYRSGRDPLTTTAALNADRAHGFTCGLYWASTWDANLDGIEAARLMGRRWKTLGGAYKRLDVQFDVEQHDPEYVSALFSEWRLLHRFAQTSWTLEGFQGPLFAGIAQQLIAGQILLVPQAYDGAMHPFCPFGVVRDLTDVGFPLERVVPFYDAARLYRGWCGFAFTAGRLP